MNNIKKPKKTKKKVNFQRLIEEAREIIELFTLHDPKPWPIEAKVLDLVSHIGIIAQATLERGGYKPKGIAARTLDKELAIVFFIMLDLAEESMIDFEKTFSEFLKKTRENLT